MDTKMTIRKGKARFWDVYKQGWAVEHVSEITDASLATMTDDDRARILRSRAAAALGSAATPRKIAASKRNGKKGGRPKAAK